MAQVNYGNNNAVINYGGAPGIPMVWMIKPNNISGCPPGLEYLSQVTALKVRQKIELLEVFTGWETNNKYAIKNELGQQVYFAMEDTDTCMRICCGAQRGFLLHIVDNANQEVMRISREFKCCAGCCWFAGSCDCCAHEVVIEAPIGVPVGYVRQTGSCWLPCFDIMDDQRNVVLKIEGPCCIFDGPCCPCDNVFEVLTLDKSTKIGSISKEYSGFIKEMVSKADNFGITFPIDLSVKTKAALLGALFLIDFMFFEKKDDNNNN